MFHITVAIIRMTVLTSSPTCYGVTQAWCYTEFDVSSFIPQITKWMPSFIKIICILWIPDTKSAAHLFNLTVWSDMKAKSSGCPSVSTDTMKIV